MVAKALLITRAPTVFAGGVSFYPQPTHTSLGRPQGTRDHVISQFESNAVWKEESIFGHYLSFFCSSMSAAIWPLEHFGEFCHCLWWEPSSISLRR